MTVLVTISLAESSITHSYNANIACVCGGGGLWVSTGVCTSVYILYIICMYAFILCVYICIVPMHA